MSKIIKIKCKGHTTLPYENIEEFQGSLKDLSKESYEKLKSEIITRGFSFPIAVWQNKGRNLTVDGHQRLRVIKQMVEKEGYACPELPVVVVSAKDLKEAKLKVLAGTSQYGHMTGQGLYEFMESSDIKFEELESSFNFAEIEFKDFQEEFYTQPVEESEEDKVPDLSPVKKTKPGEIFKLGEHRLMCGDSTDILQVEKLMDGAKADMVFTDPPYGVSYEGGHNTKKRTGIANDTLTGGDLTDLFGDSLSNAQLVSHDHAAFYIWYANGKAVETFGSFAKLNLSVRAVICWYKVKSGLGAFMSQYIPNYEPCIYAFKTGSSPQWFGPTDEKTVWELKRERVNEFHPTQKPIELPERALKNSSKLGDSVLDLFGGSGSTLIACEKTNRKCFMMELDPQYCDVILERWAIYTGKDPVSELDGKSWSQIKKDRVAETKLRKAPKRVDKPAESALPLLRKKKQANA